MRFTMAGDFSSMSQRRFTFPDRIRRRYPAFLDWVDRRHRCTLHHCTRRGVYSLRHPREWHRRCQADCYTTAAICRARLVRAIAPGSGTGRTAESARPRSDGCPILQSSRRYNGAPPAWTIAVRLSRAWDRRQGYRGQRGHRYTRGYHTDWGC